MKFQKIFLKAALSVIYLIETNIVLPKYVCTSQSYLNLGN